MLWPRLLRHAVAVAGGAGAGIREPAGADDGVGALDLAVLGSDGADRAVLVGQDVPCALPEHSDAVFARKFREGVRYVVGLVGFREHAVPALGLQGNTKALEQRLRVRGPKPMYGALQEAPVAGDGGDELARVTVVGDVAAALAGDPQLAAQHPVRFQQHDAQPAPGRKTGAERPRSAAAYYNCVSFQLSRTPYTRSTRSRGP